VCLTLSFFFFEGPPGPSLFSGGAQILRPAPHHFFYLFIFVFIYYLITYFLLFYFLSPYLNS
jgi:hypothetical protein